MKISTTLGFDGDPVRYARKARELEAAGVDLVWSGEIYGFDLVSSLAYLAGQTTTLELMTGILPIYSRTPALIAQTAATIDALSGGRFHLGLGSSGPQVIEGWHGVPFDRPLLRTREVIEICRKVWSREPLTYDGPGLPAAAAGRAGHRTRQAAEADDQAGAPGHPGVDRRHRPEERRAGRRGGRRLAADPLRPGPLPAGVGRVARGRRGEALRRPRPRCRSWPAAPSPSDRVPRSARPARPPGPTSASTSAAWAPGRRTSTTSCSSATAGSTRPRRSRTCSCPGTARRPSPRCPTSTSTWPRWPAIPGYVRDRIAVYKDIGVTYLNINVVAEEPLKVFEQVKAWAE